jgi:hypothetical protein
MDQIQESRIEFLWPTIDGYSAVNIRVVQLCVVVVKNRCLERRDEFFKSFMRRDQRNKNFLNEIFFSSKIDIFFKRVIKLIMSSI